MNQLIPEVIWPGIDKYTDPKDQSTILSVNGDFGIYNPF